MLAIKINIKEKARQKEKDIKYYYIGVGEKLWEGKELVRIKRS